MKRIFLFCLIMALCSIVFAQGHKVAGTWLGKLQVNGLALRMVLHVSQGPAGLEATVDSPDQGVNGHKVDSITLAGDKLTFALFQGSYEGTVAPGDKKITGVFTQRGMVMPLDLELTSERLDFSKPQDPKPPFPYRSEDVTYLNGKEHNTLAGTITIPQGPGPFPAVVLITGSGAQNRNEELLGHRPFLVLADYLTRRGIEVLRVDDRGVGGSSGNIVQSTTADFVTDVESGLDLLRTRTEVDKRHIGLIGHSEGGIIGPMVAAERSDVAFVVMMAGTGMSGRELLPLQAAAVESAGGMKKEDIDKSNAIDGQLFDIEVKESDPAQRKKALRDAFDSAYKSMPEAERKKTGSEDLAFAALVAQIDNPWFRYFLSLDPIPYLEKVKCPVLALNGSLDTQVPSKANLPLIKAALERGRNKRIRIEELPNLNHLFQTAKTGSPSEYANIQETIAPSALKVIGDWILSVTK